MTVVIPDMTGVTPEQLAHYAAQLSQVPDVTSVSAPGGAFVGGSLVGPPSAPAVIKNGSAFFTVGSAAPLFSAASETQLDRLHAVAGPDGHRVLMTGLAQTNRDSSKAVTSRLPLVLGLIAAITFVVLFFLTGSVVLPLKALLLNILSLSAAFGALVWIFQDGHLGAFGTTPTGTMMATIPVLLFCIAFGLSMDYEVFLVSRIREYWLERRDLRADNDECVALGLAHTARVVTAAALVMSISFAALIAAQVSFMRMLGVGLTLAVLVDATLVRVILLPAFMHVLGRGNWWAPQTAGSASSAVWFQRGGKDTGADRVCPGGDRSPCRYRFLTRSLGASNTRLRRPVAGVYYLPVGTQVPAASGGHSVWQLDARDVLQGLRIEVASSLRSVLRSYKYPDSTPSSSAASGDEGWKINSPTCFSVPKQPDCVLLRKKSCLSRVLPKATSPTGA